VLVSGGLAGQARSQQTTVPLSKNDEADVAEKPTAAGEAPADAQVPGTIHGVIRSREGGAYEGARIELARKGSAASAVQAAMSDSTGQFSFTGVLPGPFTLTVSSGGFTTQTVSGALAPGQAFEAQPVVLLMSGANSEVRVSASQVEIAQEQLHEEEHQRVLGFIPNFYVVYEANAAPLKPAQKFHLSLMSLIDPVTLAATAIGAGIDQENDDFKGFGQGAAGYAKRFGASYGSNLTSTMLGGVLLPTLLKQDPRYFYKGTGSYWSRGWYAVSTSVRSRSDKGHWEVSSGILADFASGALSNLYYAPSDRHGAGLTLENGALGTVGVAVGHLIQEFVFKHLTPGVIDVPPVPAAQQEVIK